MMYSYPKEKIEIYLSEKINQAARAVFDDHGYSVTEITGALEGEELSTIIESAHVLGVRSRSKVTAEQLAKSKRLLTVGCFTVGTDQVDLDAAETFGVPVFNAPHSSTRSVAELTIGCVISLSRRLSEQNLLMHQGRWLKSAGGSYEVRNKTMGIVGYGHIGQQVGILAEAMGMSVVYYDITRKLPLGTAKQLGSLGEVLKASDFLSLHVPSTPETKSMISSNELNSMKEGSFLINHSRGGVIDIDALLEAIKTEKIRGAALDVFPEEPGSNDSEFTSPLVDHPNILLTPHIGGSTVEAQKNIGIEVATSIIEFLESGKTEGAVNFPQASLPEVLGSHRILNVHKNVPGVLSKMNAILSESGANIERQYLSTTNEIGYMIVDVNSELSDDIRKQMSEVSESIKTRILF